MSAKQILFRISYVFAMVGGLVALAGGWLMAQPTEGANIGAGLLIIAATGLMGIALINWVISVIVALTIESSPKR